MLVQVLELQSLHVREVWNLHREVIPLTHSAIIKAAITLLKY